MASHSPFLLLVDTSHSSADTLRESQSCVELTPAPPPSAAASRLPAQGSAAVTDALSCCALQASVLSDNPQRGRRSHFRWDSGAFSRARLLSGDTGAFWKGPWLNMLWQVFFFLPVLQAVIPPFRHFLLEYDWHRAWHIIVLSIFPLWGRHTHRKELQGNFRRERQLCMAEVRIRTVLWMRLMTGKN